ncbi:toll-like receptor 5 [Genypterus blacodes]|uniref:toll-like receptor 5 n=1 Tax=Genypterus blacodes TaxID=154954 RepID=UPI003F762A68
MWTLALQVALVGVFLQVAGCSPSCLIKGSIANCASQKHRRIPALPPYITHLYLPMNYIRELDETSLSGLEQLQQLDLGQQFVPLVIRNNTFSRQQNLVKLVLGFNIGLQLEQRAFVGLSSLQILHLDYCSLQESILKENYLEPLSSLETLNLFGNRINRLQPSLFFSNLTKLTNLNLKLNKIDMICEADLAAFRGKHFNFLNLDSIHLNNMNTEGLDWKKCGNPFRGMSFQKIDLSYNGLSATKSKLLFKAIRGTRINHLKMSGPMGKGFSFQNLPDPDQSTFEGLKDSAIRILDLSKNRIFALQQRVFSPLKEVEVIEISQNRINRIHKNAFEGLQGHLKMLNLSHNLLGEIYSHTFASLKALQVLDLSHNHIGALGYGSFSGLPNLRALELTGNSLRDLGFPASLPRLEYLFLSDNKLMSSSAASLTQFATNITHLMVENNRLTNLGDVFLFLTRLKRLQYLAFGKNTMERCNLPRRAAESGLNNLQTLDLHRSSLQVIWSQGRCLDIFDNLNHLISLRLSFNSLQFLPQGVFKGLTSVEDIDLSFNTLTYLQPDILPKSLRRLDLSNNFIASPDPAAFHSLSRIDLSMNRFHCNPNLQSFLVWMKETNVTFLKPVEELRCEFPLEFYNVPLLDYSAQTHQS